MKRAARRCRWLVALGLAACAAAPKMPDPLPSDPASSAAAEAPREAPSDTLRIEPTKERR
ncbi:MAG: hypothetical protein H6838_01215 [Planctomycetes bacterium]|nr:hypothetical protein [Planctomycetota bacterium]MCB9884076.1 hypothetical protein [Planctomycetota bacterium]